MDKPEGNEVQCVNCHALFADMASFEEHEHVICVTEGLIALDRKGRTVYARPTKTMKAAKTMDIKW